MLGGNPLSTAIINEYNYGTLQHEPHIESVETKEQ
jgi:hypothetical protein